MAQPTSIKFAKQLPALSSLGEEVLVIYDEILQKKVVGFRSWLAQAHASYPVTAGESLKAVENFARHLHGLTRLSEKLSSRRLVIVVVGGGSVGDFGGFVASTFKRGLPLIHIPSTWLAAIDSAHGGKTGLNVSGLKNQVGTFYPAEKVFLVRSLLLSQPESRAFEAFGELLKISLIHGGAFWRDLRKETEVCGALIWKYLPQAVAAKMKVVREDPQERNGLRHVLNLGHTLGHVLESHYEIPHGIAVNYGLHFAVEWSLQKKIMSHSDYEKLVSQPIWAYALSPQRDHLLSSRESVLRRFGKILAQDKKKTQGSSLRFVFLRKPGKFVIREVEVSDVLREICRQHESGLYG